METFDLRWRLGKQGLLLFEKGELFEVSNLGTEKRGVIHEFNSLKDVKVWLRMLEGTKKKKED